MAGKTVPRIVIVLAVLFVLACGVVLVVLRSLDSIVHDGIEREGPKVTGTSVNVGRVHLDLREGRGEFRDLMIGNPDGFSGDDALQLGEIVLDIDPESLTKEPYVIEEIRVGTSTLRLELNEKGASNLERIRKHIESYAPAPAAEGSKPPPRLIVKRLVFDGAKVQVDARSLGGKESEWTLDPVELRDIGGANGVPADQVAKVALEKLVRETTKKAAREGLKDAAERNLGDKAKDAIGGLFGKGDGE